MSRRDELLRKSKKEIVNLCGYINIKHLCKENKDMRRKGGKAPSKKQLIREIL